MMKVLVQYELEIETNENYIETEKSFKEMCKLVKDLHEASVWCHPFRVDLSESTNFKITKLDK